MKKAFAVAYCNGNLLAVHCASGANNMIITGVSGFTSVARPNFYKK